MINSDEEFSIVVDKSDRILCYKRRGDLSPTDRIRATGVWIEDAQGNVLLAQRSFKKQLHPGLWGPAAAGGVAKDETYKQNAYKELEEEIGITGILLTSVDRAAVDHSDGTKRYVAWFKGKLTTPPQAQDFLLEDAVEKVAWLTKEWIKQDIAAHPENYIPSAVEHWHNLFLR